MKRRLDFGLYLVTDRALSLPRTVAEVVSAAVEGGVTAVQLREKEASTLEYIELARHLKNILKPLGIPLIINDRVDVALAVGADGVHIGQRDMPFRDARRLMSADSIIGLSVETPEQALEADKFTADYLGVSPIFSTPTKPDTTSEWGLEGLRTLRAGTSRTLIAIGGIQVANAAAVMRAGADGLAVVSAICSAVNPEEVARELRVIVEQNRGRNRTPS